MKDWLERRYDIDETVYYGIMTALCAVLSLSLAAYCIIRAATASSFSWDIPAALVFMWVCCGGFGYYTELFAIAHTNSDRKLCPSRLYQNNAPDSKTAVARCTLEKYHEGPHKADSHQWE